MKLAKWGLLPAIESILGILIAMLMNNFFSTSFGLAMFPSEWAFPGPESYWCANSLFSTMIISTVLQHYRAFPGHLEI